MNKKILIITSILMIMLGCFSICFASNDLQILEREHIVDYKVADEFYEHRDGLFVHKKYFIILNPTLFPFFLQVLSVFLDSN